MILSELNDFNLLNITRGHMAHGVNCVGAMGAGVAKQIAHLYPDVLAHHKMLCQDNSLEPGDVYAHRIGALTIWNLATQRFYGQKGGANVEWVKQCISLMDADMHQHIGNNPVYMPRIGCGFGRLAWEDVRPIIEDAKIGYIICHKEI